MNEQGKYIENPADDAELCDCSLPKPTVVDDSAPGWLDRAHPHAGAGSVRLVATARLRRFPGTEKGGKSWKTASSAS